MRVEEAVEIAREPEVVWELIADPANDPPWCPKVEPPSCIRLRQEDHTSVFEVEYRLERVPAGTRLVQVSEFEWKRLPRVLHGAFARGVRRDVRRQLHALKKVLERNSPDHVSGARN